MADVAFTDKERAALRHMFNQLGDLIDAEDPVSLIIQSGAAVPLGVQTTTTNESGQKLFRMIRNDPEIHDFLSKVYTE